jgi:hypothetical protein
MSSEIYRGCWLVNRDLNKKKKVYISGRLLDATPPTYLPGGYSWAAWEHFFFLRSILKPELFQVRKTDLDVKFGTPRPE